MTSCQYKAAVVVSTDIFDLQDRILLLRSSLVYLLSYILPASNTQVYLSRKRSCKPLTLPGWDWTLT